MFDNFANRCQASVVRRGWGPSVVGALVGMVVRMFVITSTILNMLAWLLLPENFARQILFPVCVDVDFRCGNAAAQHPGNLQSPTDIEPRNCVFHELSRHAGIEQRAKKHVTADARKAVEVGYAHSFKSLSHRAHRGTQ